VHTQHQDLQSTSYGKTQYKRDQCKFYLLQQDNLLRGLLPLQILKYRCDAEENRLKIMNNLPEETIAKMKDKNTAY
jgi:hypothetical protein